MRIVFAVCAALLLSGAPVALAGDPVADAAPQTRAQRLDALFSDLKRQRNEQAAARIAARIQDEWNSSGSASIDLMMQWSQKAIEEEKFAVALDFLDQVVVLEPAYAEGWNRRATLHYLMKDYAKSMADIDRTLRLEPRHFGALAGLARIMADTGRKEQALEAWQRVLDIYPMLRDAQDQVAALSEELTGEAI